jgi:hypothetical protein
MIRYFSKNSYRWSIFGLLLILVLGGCVLTDTKSTTTQEQNNTSNSSQNNSSTQGGQNEIGNKPESNIHIVQNSGDELAGSLSKEVSIGQIHIGDSKSQVFRLFGTPDERKEVNIGYESWIYKKHDMTIQYYRSSKEMPVGGVASIKIGANSDLKTDIGIGISAIVEHIEKGYVKLNTNDKLTSIWVNGANKVEGNGYYPSLKFDMDNNQVKAIELSNNGVDPGPYQQKSISLADLEIGVIRIGGSIDDVINKYGQPSEKTIAHGLGSPYWIFKKQGFTIDFGGPIWRISILDSFEGSTPRGIHIGSNASEVIEAYPDVTKGESYAQRSTDGQYTIQFDMKNGKVTQITISRDYVLE